MQTRQVPSKGELDVGGVEGKAGSQQWVALLVRVQLLTSCGGPAQPGLQTGAIGMGCSMGTHCVLTLPSCWTSVCVPG